MVRDKKVEGISEIRDESDRDGVRLVIELKRDAMADVVLNQLYRYTPLQTTFGVNALALDGGRPKLMSLKELLEAFIRFRAGVITRRTKYELNHARDRAHVLVGLAIGCAAADEVSHPTNSFRVKAVHWLVKDQRVWVAEKSAGDAKALPHAE